MKALLYFYAMLVSTWCGAIIGCVDIRHDLMPFTVLFIVSTVWAMFIALPPMIDAISDRPVIDNKTTFVAVAVATFLVTAAIVAVFF